MKPDPSGLPNTYVCDTGEEIQVVTTVDHPPFLAQFPDQPRNSKWESVTPDWGNLKDMRTFLCSGSAANPVTFVVAYKSEIPDGAPYDNVTYRITFTSLTNPGDPPQTVTETVPKGAAPILDQYTFNVA